MPSVRFALLLCCLACAAISACAAPADASAEPRTEPPAITLTTVDFVDSHGDVVFARGHAKSLTYLSESGESVATDLKVRFPRADRPGSAVDIAAPKAHGNPLEARVEGEGGVHLENQKGHRGDTEAASYDGQRGMAHGEAAVTLAGPGFVLHAPGFRWRAAGDVLDLGRAEVLTQDAAGGGR